MLNCLQLLKEFSMEKDVLVNDYRETDCRGLTSLKKIYSYIFGRFGISDSRKIE